MEFYKIWRGWGGTIGVNRLSLGDLLVANLIAVLVYVVLLAVFVTILPTILIGIYLLWIIGTDMEGGEDNPNIQQRNVLMIMSIVSVIYFMIDFHFGLIAYNILGSGASKETMDGIAIYNLSLGFVSVILFFLGHRAYASNQSRFLRIIFILALTWFSYRFTKKIATPIVNNLITQCTDSDHVNGVRDRDSERERYERGEYVP